VGRRQFCAPLIVLGVLAVQAGLASPAHAAGQRYAAPTGSGSACTSAAPCDIVTAINQASSSTEVILFPGSYNTGATSLSNTQFGINVHGIAGQPHPVITSSADYGLALTGTGARVSDLTIDHTGAIYGLNVFAPGVVIDRVQVHSTGAIACTAGISGVARDLLCLDTAAGGIALDDSWGNGTFALTLRNVTALATGAGSYGIRADASGANTNLDISARNVIASGTKADIRSTETPANDSTSESDVLLSYSNYDTIEEGGGGNVTNVGSGTTNQTAQPIFADAAGHQAPTSPTRDKGTTDTSVGVSDYEGEPRKNGTAVDIGADEWWPDTTPPDTVFTHTPKAKSHKRKAVFIFHASEPATFLCTLDKHKTKPCHSPFKLKHRKYGKHQLTVTAVDTSGNVDPTPAVWKWKIKHRHKRPGHHHHHHNHHHHH
jgi:hypothetical protein